MAIYYSKSKIRVSKYHIFTEGLGGDPLITEELIGLSGMNWALFRNFSMS